MRGKGKKRKQNGEEEEGYIKNQAEADLAQKVMVPLGVNFEME